MKLYSFGVNTEQAFSVVHTHNPAWMIQRFTSKRAVKKGLKKQEKEYPGIKRKIYKITIEEVND